MALLPIRTLSKRGALFIARFEGLRTTPYNDAAGHATIGYGHLIHYGSVTADDRAKYAHFTEAAALKLLQRDAGKAAKAVRAIRPRITSQTRFDALVSIAFNCGPGILDPNRSLGDALRAPGRRGAGEAFLLYDRAGGKVLAGLKTRREAERRLWRDGRYV